MLYIAAAGLVLLLLFGSYLHTVSGKVRMKTETFEVSGGWGYLISLNGRTYIYQPFIPGYDKHPFPDRKTARKAARIVTGRLKTGSAPGLSEEDLQRIGIIKKDR